MLARNSAIHQRCTLQNRLEEQNAEINTGGMYF